MKRAVAVLSLASAWSVLEPAVGAAAAMVMVATTASAQVNVLTANYGTDRTNANLSETQLTPTTVTQSQFGRLGMFPVDGQVYAQPLYVSAREIPGRGTHNMLFVATQHDSVYAYDADSLGQPLVLWHVNLGPSVPSMIFGPEFHDIEREIGILSTPVIDLGRGVIYVVSMSLMSGRVVYRLHALDLANGQERLNGPAVIGGSVLGNGAGTNGDGTMSFDPMWHLQRPGLLLLNGAVYIAFGSHADQGVWHGWLISYDGTDLTHQFGAFITTPNGIGGSIWQSGRGLAADDVGNIYAITGNGDFDGQSNLSESFLKFSGSVPRLVDWYAPANWQFLTEGDYDLSAGVALVPGTHILVAGDKYGQIYRVNGDSMGQLGGDSQVIQAAQWGGIFNFAIWSRSQVAYMYVREPGSVVKCYELANGQFSSTAVTLGTVESDSVYGGMAISANGTENGILWETTAMETTAIRSGSVRRAILHAYDASSLRELWNSEMSGADAVGAFAKFVTPTIANGKVYVPTFSDTVVVYGLTSGAADP